MSNATVPAAEVSTPAATVGVGSLLTVGLASTFCALLVVGGAGFWLVRSGHLGGPGATKVVAEEHAEAKPSHLLPLEPMIVNLSDPGGRSYLRATVTLRLEDVPAPKEEKKEEGKPKAGGPDADLAAELRDTVLTVLSSQTADGLLGAGGRDAAKKALQTQLAEHNPAAHVVDVYFTDFLVQRG